MPVSRTARNAVVVNPGVVRMSVQKPADVAGLPECSGDCDVAGAGIQSRELEQRRVHHE